MSSALVARAGQVDPLARPLLPPLAALGGLLAVSLVAFGLGCWVCGYCAGARRAVAVALSPVRRSPPRAGRVDPLTEGFALRPRQLFST